MQRKSTKEDWQKYWISADHQPQVIHRELLDNLMAITTIEGKKILEVGAGMGGDSLFLAKKGAQVTVLDFNQEALEKIKTSAKEIKADIRTVLADARKIPFNNEVFDIVFHQGFLEHFHDPMALIKEQSRVLRNKGILLIDVPQKYTTYTIKKHRAIRRKKWFAGWEKEYTIKELESLIKKSGFQIIKSYGWGYYGKIHLIRCLKLGKWYEFLWKKIESSRLKLYLNFSIGVIARKNESCC